MFTVGNPICGGAKPKVMYSAAKIGFGKDGSFIKFVSLFLFKMSVYAFVWSN
jgi:hypothetical protein